MDEMINILLYYQQTKGRLFKHRADYRRFKIFSSLDEIACLMKKVRDFLLYSLTFNNSLFFATGSINLITHERINLTRKNG